MAFCATLNSSSRLIIAAPSIYLAHLIHHFSHIKFASQDVSSAPCDYGAFTGEVSAKQLSCCSVQYCIIGHSERRRHYLETSLSVKQKAENCIKHGIIPIICIGETKESRDSGEYIKDIKKQLLASIPNDGECILAYEPIWAVGTGILPSAQQLEEISDLLKPLVKPLSLVYGGSINSGNISYIRKVKQIDGILLGGASLDALELAKILQIW
jgi:triosephosphate isomerase